MNIGTNFRLRSVHPVIGSGEMCGLLYDLERTLVFEVPEGLRPGLISALKTGKFEGAQAEWLKNEDILTYEMQKSWAQGWTTSLPAVTDFSIDISGNCNLRCVYCFEKDIESRTGTMENEVVASSLDFIFKKAKDAPYITIHFGSGEPLMSFGSLKRIVDEVIQYGDFHGKKVFFELTTNATLVNEEIAMFLCDNHFKVRVSCDGPPEIHNRFRPYQGGNDSYEKTEKGLNLLLAYLPERLTVNSVISGGTRLSSLWNWAEEVGLKHYHVIKVGAEARGETALDETELQNFRMDLEAICDELLRDLDANRLPIDFQPITKIIRRLMIPSPITRFCGVAGTYLGLSSNGRIYPCFRYLGLEQYELGDVWYGVDDRKRQAFLCQEASDVDSRLICSECWARYLCGGACYADPSVYGKDRLKPLEQHCPFWRAEVEQAIKFYDKLLDTDPNYCLRLFGDDIDKILDLKDYEPDFNKSKNCS